MEFLAGLYTLLLVAICLLQALLLYRTGKPAARQDDEALKEWLRQQLEAQARVLEEKQAQQAQQKTVTAAVSPPKKGILFEEINSPRAIQNAHSREGEHLCKSHPPKSPKPWRW